MLKSTRPDQDVGAAEQQILEIVSQYPAARAILIFAPGMPWQATMFQRPQQLALALARRGALVFYMQPKGSADSSGPLFNTIERGLILCNTQADAFHVVPQAFVYAVPWNLAQLAFFSAPRVVYDFLDDLSVFPGNRMRMERDHREYLAKADLVLVTAARLQRMASPMRADCLLCPNGVDVRHFDIPKPPVPHDMAPILAEGKPVIGYHGALARWVDYQLLRTLARDRPDLSFVLVGADHDQTFQSSGLRGLPNIHWLGAKPYSELPAYVSHFEVGLIPFQVNEITHSTSPIKLFEYFASGKPVIVPPLEESKRSTLVLVANTPDDWLEKIDQAMALGKDPDFVQRLRASALENSWEERADRILGRMQTMGYLPPVLPWYARISPHNAMFGRIFRWTALLIKAWHSEGGRGVAKIFYYKLRENFRWMEHLLDRRVPRAFADTYIPEDNSQVVVFSDDAGLFPNYWPRQGMLPPAGHPDPKVTLIATTYNEMEHLGEWMESVLMQTVRPDEIVITDGGSNDGTVEALEQYSRTSPVPVRIIHAPGANISRGRNIAIVNAQHDLIAASDCGCRLHPDWLENLITPFRVEPRTQVSAGWYHPVDRHGRDLPHWDWPSLEQLNPQSFIPSSRSLAFTREAWKMAGGYPEWLTRTGEDTYFALELKRFCSRWGFVPSAVVDWYGPGSGLVILKAYPWAIGDGETGYKAWEYRRKARRILIGIAAYLLLVMSSGFILTGWLKVPTLAAWIGSSLATGFIFLLGASFINRVPLYRPFSMLAIRIAQVIGFWIGARRKNIVERRRLAATRGVFFILAGVPIDDTGGGARCTQIALELLRQNYWVVYINRYPKYESKDSGTRIVHPNLHTFTTGEFRWDRFQKEYRDLLELLPIYGLVDFPSKDFLPLLHAIRASRGTLFYEMVDDWNTSLGGDWYSPSVEEEIIKTSDGLIATAPLLQEKFEQIHHRKALLLPNAVNSRLFNPERLYQRPADLPRAEWLAIYVGALWGDWFDWDILKAVAEEHPQAAVVVVGDYRGQCNHPPANLHFLGLKPQTDIPAYLAHSQVALIPWKVNQITQATSPLKLYEYLAMHLPVVAPDLKPLSGTPGVYLARERKDFIDFVARVWKAEFPIHEVDRFIQSNNWQNRIARLLEYVSQVANGGFVDT